MDPILHINGLIKIVESLPFANEDNRKEMLRGIMVLFKAGCDIGKYLMTCTEKLTHQEALMMAMESSGLELVEDEEGHTAVYKDGQQV